MARRQLNQEQRRELIREQLRETPEKSDRQIAKDLGISHHTVASQRDNMERCGQIAHAETTIDTLGREQPRNRKPVSVFNPITREQQALKQPEIVNKMAETGINTAGAIRETKRGVYCRLKETHPHFRGEMIVRSRFTTFRH